MTPIRKLPTRWDRPPTPEHDFTVYQREDSHRILASRYTVRRRLKDGDSAPPTGPLNLDGLKDDDVEITPILENQEIFSYAGRFEMPVLTLTLPDALWIGDQLFDLQKSYFGQMAAVEWGLYTTSDASDIGRGRWRWRSSGGTRPQGGHPLRWPILAKFSLRTGISKAWAMVVINPLSLNGDDCQLLTSKTILE